MSKAKGSLTDSRIFHTRLSLDEVRERLQMQPVYYKGVLDERRLVFDHSYFYVPEARFDDAYRTTIFIPWDGFKREGAIRFQVQLFLTSVQGNGTRVKLMIGNSFEVNNQIAILRWLIPIMLIVSLATFGSLAKELSIACLIPSGIITFAYALIAFIDARRATPVKQQVTAIIMELLDYDPTYEKTLYFNETPKP